eukprot:6368597-Prymnesium_polylepis.1
MAADSRRARAVAARGAALGTRAERFPGDTVPRAWACRRHARGGGGGREHGRVTPHAAGPRRGQARFGWACQRTGHVCRLCRMAFATVRVVLRLRPAACMGCGGYLPPG